MAHFLRLHCLEAARRSCVQTMLMVSFYARRRPLYFWCFPWIERTLQHQQEVLCGGTMRLSIVSPFPPVFPPPFSPFSACFLFPSDSLPLCRAAPHVLPAMSPPCPSGLGRCLACATSGLNCRPACTQRLPRRSVRSRLAATIPLLMNDWLLCYLCGRGFSLPGRDDH